MVGSSSGLSALICQTASAPRSWAANRSRSATFGSDPRKHAMRRSAANAAIASSLASVEVAITNSSRLPVTWESDSMRCSSIGRSAKAIRILPGRRRDDMRLNNAGYLHSTWSIKRLRMQRAMRCSSSASCTSGPGSICLNDGYCCDIRETRSEFACLHGSLGASEIRHCDIRARFGGLAG